MLRNVAWARRLANTAVHPNEVVVVGRGSQVYLPKLQVRLSAEDDLFLLRHYPLALSLVEKAGAGFHRASDGQLFVHVANVRAAVHNGDELCMLKEIFLYHIYNLQRPEPVVVLDIGMNVGLAALYFAATLPDVNVIGYEPISDTYEMALRNFALNPDLAKRIRSFNAGIGGANSTVDAYYVSELHGSSGLFPLPSDSPHFSNQAKRQVQLRSAPEVLDEVLREFPGRTVVAKIDCEGAEYAIIRALSSSRKLQNLSCVIMEWHKRAPDHNPQEIVEELKEAGFTVFLTVASDSSTGMMYAVQHRPRSHETSR
jgi:FkbM family methyltransferase